MKDKAMDGVSVECPTCHNVYLGQHVNNKWESAGICDWCALGMMLREAGVEPYRGPILRATFKDGRWTEEVIEVSGKPYAPLPSEVN